MLENKNESEENISSNIILEYKNLDEQLEEIGNKLELENIINNNIDNNFYKYNHNKITRKNESDI